MRFLKQSTSVDLPIGPFLDATDGVTAETALTLTQPDIRLKKNGGAWAQKAAAQTLSHEENGNYEVTLDATDTDTLGCLRLHVAESGALPVWEDFMVVPANIWDSWFGSDKQQVHADEITNGLITAAAIADNAIDAGAIASDAITSAKIADGALTAAKLAADCITAAKLAADVTTELQSGLATAAALDTVDNLLDTEVAAIKTVVDAIQAKTDNLPSDPADASVIAGLIDALPTAAENFTAVLTTQLTEAYAADGAAPTLAQAIFLIQQMLGDFAISGTTLTVKKLDGSTTAATFTLSDASSPTSLTRSG
jgi:hypothetical protein